MPRGGQNRLPAAAKRARGTLEKHREKPPTGPMASPSSVPAPPKRMAATERACWMELAAQVEGLGVYTVSDFSAFKLLVRTVWMAEQADGFMPPTARVRLAQAAHSALASFGLSPASRGKVAAAPKRERDAVAEFLGLTAIPGGKG